MVAAAYRARAPWRVRTKVLLLCFTSVWSSQGAFYIDAVISISYMDTVILFILLMRRL